MPFFLYRLTPPRPTFPADITPEEGAAMQRHFGYWQSEIEKGNALVVGPVADPAGTFGLAILAVPDEKTAQAIVANDPALKAALGFASQVHAMPDTMAAGVTA